jgi:hypothetical protein
MVIWPGMNKRLETLMALAEVEEKVRILQSLTPEQQSKLDALRETINRSIEEGGTYTDEEVAAYIEQVHADAERKGR